MTILNIPVTRFSKRIIEASHEKIQTAQSSQPIIPLRDRDPLYLHLCIRRERERFKSEQLTNLLTDTVTIGISDNMVQHVSVNLKSVGYYLNRIHREALNELIWWETKELHNDDNCDLEAKAVIERFCLRYKIQLDTELNYDTLYKSWTRYKFKMRALIEKNKNNSAIFGKNDSHAVRQISRKSQRKISAAYALHIPDKILDATILAYFEKYQKPHFQTLKGEKRVFRFLQLKLYVYRVIGGRPMRQCAERFNVKLKKAYEHVTTFQAFLKDGPIVTIERAVDTEGGK